MKLKLTSEGHAVVKDGKPVYVEDDGKEIAFDVDGTVATIARINAEAKANRQRFEKAEAKIAVYDDAGITDAEKARKALDVVSRLDEKKLVDAGERDKAIAEAIKAVEAKYEPIVANGKAAEQQLNDYVIKAAFNDSDFVAKKFLVKGPAAVDTAMAIVGRNFKVQNGKAVAYDAAGNPIYSRANPGELASPNEAIEILVNAYPHAKDLLAGTEASGGGAQGGGSGGSNQYQRTGPKLTGAAADKAARVADIAARFPQLAQDAK